MISYAMQDDSPKDNDVKVVDIENSVQQEE
jgi:hypothetical protein